MFNNFLKPGKGVEKEIKRKNGFFQYFYSVYLNITKLFFINFINIPLIAVYGFFMTSVKNELKISTGFSYPFDILSVLIYCLIGIPPVFSGLYGILSSMSKEKPIFFLNDLKDGIKKNIKETSVIFLVNIIFLYFMTVAYKFYFVGGFGNGVMKLMFFIVLFIYLTMNIFVGYITVTYKLKVKDIYKKALLFTFLNLPQNIIVMVGLVLINGLVFSLTTLLGYLFTALLTFSFTMLIINLYAVRTIEKYEIK